MCKIRLVGIDMDGTLLSTDKTISPYTMEILKEVHRSGVEIVIATGRPYLAIKDLQKELPFLRYFLSSNGARVMDAQGDKTLIEALLPREKGMEALKLLGEYDAITEAYFDGLGYIAQKDYDRIELFHKNPNMVKYFKKTRKAIPDLLAHIETESRDMDKCQALFHDMLARKEAWARLEVLGGLALVNSLDYNIEINHFEVNKGTSLIKLAGLLGFEGAEVMAIGDNDNDKAMLEMAGLGVAMANSVPEILGLADYVTTSNDEEGVALALKKFILEDKPC